MDIFDLMWTRRSIRKYQDRQIPRQALEQVLRAGSWAPNAGGGQRTMLVGLRDRTLVERLGRVNAACMDRSRLLGGHVSAEQPSIIDDPAIKSGFYGAPAVCAVFAPENFLYSIPDAFCCAENMVLAATGLGLASCIVARGEETFDNSLGRELMKGWGVPEGWKARCFVLLGYCAGDYPAPKARRAGSWAPNAGGGQRTMLVGLRDRTLVERLGRVNAACMDRSRLLGGHVSAEQPSIIDDPAIKSGFYGAPAVCAVFAPENFLYSIPDAFCCAENMVLAATGLGLASCIVARGEETFDNSLGRELMKGWGVPEGWKARCFVLLGYCAGDYPAPKARRAGRVLIIDGEER